MASTEAVATAVTVADSITSSLLANATVGTLDIRLGEAVRLPFVACDFDGLPVAHGLPAAPPHDDQRSFEAALWPLVVDGTTGELVDDPFGVPTTLATEYLGGALYEAVVQPWAPRAYALRLTLGGAPVGSELSVTAVCPGGLVPTLAGDSCGCDAGSELRDGAVTFVAPPRPPPLPSRRRPRRHRRRARHPAASGATAAAARLAADVSNSFALATASTHPVGELREAGRHARGSWVCLAWRRRL